MDIVPAGMHDAGMSRFVRYIVGFLYGQRVHVGPQGDGFAICSGTFNHRNDPGAGNPSLVRDFQLVKCFLYKACGLLLFEGKLRIAVQMSAQVNNMFSLLVGELLNVFTEFQSLLYLFV